MGLAERCAGAFDPEVRARGARYFEEDQVLLEPVAKNMLDAVVGSQGDMEEVTLDWSDAYYSNVLDVSCSCPVAEEEPCEHVWAAILAADDSRRGPRGKGPLGVLVGDPYEEDEEEDFDDEPDPWEDSYRGRASSFGGGRFPWLTSRPASKTGWRQRLSAAFERPSSSAASRPIPILEKTREAWYVLDLAASFGVGTLFIRFYQRETKKNGEFGKLKPQGVGRNEIDRFNRPEDREVLRLLMASDQPNGYSSYYPDRYRYSYSSYDPKLSAVSLAPGAYEWVLPKLCATGRFVWIRDESTHRADDEDLPRLAWDDGPPWRFRLRIEPDDAKKRWRLEGELVREGEPAPVPLQTPLLLLAHGLVVWPDRLARLDPGDSFPLIAALRSGPPIEVPYRDRWELLRHLWELPSPPEMDLPESLRAAEVRAAPQPRLIVHAPSPRGPKRLDADVEFQYDDKRVGADEPSAGLVDAKQERVLVRDRVKEQELLRALLEHGAEPPKTSYDRHNVSIPQRRFPDLMDSLIEAGWTVEAEGHLIRKPGACRLSVTSGVDWFDLDGACDFEGVAVELPDLLQAVARGQNYVQLGDGTRGLLPKQWLEQFAALAGLGKTEGDHVRFRRSQALLLDALLAARGEVRVDQQFAEIRRKLRSFEGVSAAPEPPGFQGQLRNYQREGLGWLGFLRDFGFGGCLADDMGLGKTVQVLALLQDRHARPPDRHGRRAPSLVVAPRSLVFNWIEEARRFTPELRVLDYTGLSRKGLLERADQYDLLVTTYGTMQRDVAELKDLRFDYAILDEAQAIKNAHAQRAKASRLLQADHRLALTGTPVENHLGELWSIFEFLNPGMLGSSSVFQDLSKRITQTDEDLALLRRALAPFILRRTKEQVLTELPAKTEQTLYCELEGKQRKLYDELRDYYRAMLSKRIEQAGMAKAKIHVLEALLRLRQAAIHPGLLDKEKADQPSVKLDLLLEQLREVLDEGHKALVFSQFTSFLSIVRRRLDAEKISYEYLDGRTRDRQSRVERFQNDPDCRLFLISLKAGGHGLNLTAADYVFLLDPWWNPAVEAQAIDRTHRIGQTRQVFAYRLIARDTVEEKVVELQKTKRHLADAIITGDGNLLRELTAEDLNWLLA